jgi:cell filamentation protein
VSPPDPYVYPGTEVLRNKFNIRDAVELSEREANITAVAAAELAARPVHGDFDLPHLQAIHARLFGDIYPWAGQLRTVAIAKGSLFCLPQHIESYAADTFGRLARDEMLRGRPLREFVDAAAGYLADINALHPFRDGNGRAQRAFIGQLAQQAGYTIRWHDVTAEANLAVSIASFHGDAQPLAELLQAVTRKTEPTGPSPPSSPDELARGRWGFPKPPPQVLGEAAPPPAAGYSIGPSVDRDPGTDTGLGR